MPRIATLHLSRRGSTASDKPLGTGRSGTSHRSAASTALEHEASPLVQIAEVVREQEDAARRLEESASSTAAADTRESVAELLATERHYLDDLRFVVERFIEPLRPLLGRHHLAIFSNLEQLKELHTKLEQELALIDAGAAPTAERELAQVRAYVGLLPFFKMYAAYCANYPHAAAALLEARSEPRVAALIDEAEAARGAALQALLFRPVQRMCVYPLLLHAVVASADESLPLRELSRRAFEGMRNLNVEVNESVRQAEERLRLASVLTKEVDDVEHLLQASRRLELEAEVYMKQVGTTFSSWGRRRGYKWYVLSDYLLVCRPKGGGACTKKALWPLDEVDILSSDPAQLGDDALEQPRSSSSLRGRLFRRNGSRDPPRADSISSAPGSADRSVVGQDDDSDAEEAPLSAGGPAARRDKPEVLRIAHGSTEYKCWAASGEEAQSLVKRICALKLRHAEVSADLASRQMRIGSAA